MLLHEVWVFYNWDRWDGLLNIWILYCDLLHFVFQNCKQCQGRANDIWRQWTLVTLGANSLFGVHSSLALSLIPIITQNSTSCRNRRWRRNIKKARKFIVKMYNNGCYTHNGNWFAIKRRYLSVCDRGITRLFFA